MQFKNNIQNTDSGPVRGPLVSVIVMTYNSATYILNTLESARLQTYQNIELIVTDDCSSDHTLELASSWITKYRERFVRCEIVTTPFNTGIPSNCNRGIGRSEGEWIKIIAGDDILADSCIETFISEVVRSRDLKFIASDMNYINSEGKPVADRDTRYNFIRKYFFSLTREEQLKMYARFPLFLNSPSFFMHRDTLESVGLFDEEFRIYDDLPLIFRLLEHGIRISHISGKTVNYRMHENSLSRTGKKDISSIRLKEQVGCFDKYRKKYLSNFNLIDLTVRYDFWLEHSYKGLFGIKMLPLMYLFNFYQKYLSSLAEKYRKSFKAGTC